jgi:hypothetical protein
MLKDKIGDIKVRAVMEAFNAVYFGKEDPKDVAERFGTKIAEECQQHMAPRVIRMPTTIFIDAYYYTLGKLCEEDDEKNGRILECIQKSFEPLLT